jgi:WD40 repeat protein
MHFPFAAVNLRFYCRCMFALALGGIVAAVAYYWPAAPRLVLRHEHMCWDFAFSRDSRMLAVLDHPPGLDTAGQVLVWDVATGTQLHRLDFGIRTHASAVVFAPDGKSLGVLDAGRVMKWDLSTGRLIADYDGDWSHDPDHGRELLFGADGRWLLHGTHEGRIFDVATGAIVHDYGGRFPDRSRHAQGGCIAACVNGEVKTFDAITGAEVATFTTAGPRGPMARTSFTCSADGTHGVYFARNENVVHNASTGQECVWGRGDAAYADAHLSPDNRFLAVAISNSRSGVLGEVPALVVGARWSLHVIDTTTGAEVCRPIPHGVMASFAPDGKTLAVSDRDRNVTLWDWPPLSRWPFVLALTLPTILLSYLIAGWRWRGGQRSGSGGGRSRPAHQPRCRLSRFPTAPRRAGE